MADDVYGPSVSSIALTKHHARVAELVDACASGAYVLTDVEVQVLSRVPL